MAYPFFDSKASNFDLLRTMFARTKRDKKVFIQLFSKKLARCGARSSTYGPFFC